jgi:hypothetical protein
MELGGRKIRVFAGRRRHDLRTLPGTTAKIMRNMLARCRKISTFHAGGARLDAAQKKKNIVCARFTFVQ